MTTRHETPPEGFLTGLGIGSGVGVGAGAELVLVEEVVLAPDEPILMNVDE